MEACRLPEHWRADQQDGGVLSHRDGKDCPSGDRTGRDTATGRSEVQEGAARHKVHHRRDRGSDQHDVYTGGQAGRRGRKHSSFISVIGFTAFMDVMVSKQLESDLVL